MTGPAMRALVLGPGAETATVVGPSGAQDGEPEVVAATTPDEVDRLVGGLVDLTRWVLWQARDATALLARDIALPRVWEVAEAHRVLHGGSEARPTLAWAAAHDLDPATVPEAPSEDLFGLLAPDEDPDAVVRPDGHLRPEADQAWCTTPARAEAWGRAALEVAYHQRRALEQRSPRAVVGTCSESAAAVLAVELERDGLPVDRERLAGIIAAAAGPRPRHEADELAARVARDAPVLAAVPGIGRVDLRNPASVRSLLATAGVDVPSTRKWVLEEHRDRHPVVPALLAWRKAERIATTYGWRWLAEHVGPDDRLRGRWAASDGAAGRMTAQAGLHNLPAELRPGIAAAAGHLFVRADLGQIEPRVLAAVSADRAFAAATAADDLYSPVAERLGVDRPVAKVAVLAAMYGQRSGPAGEALRGLERAYPVAMGHLESAQRRGEAGLPVLTYGGRVVPTGWAPPGDGVDAAALARARGRFARNAVIQGSAAELFKAWAVTVREAVRPLGARVVLCLHDELLVHVPQEEAPRCAALVDEALVAAARRWVGHDEVRFVADTSLVRRWSDAKA